ncbi:MAG TPA: hypothetical protein VLC28_06230, partial [Flavitalea sp.]|nr:hypothetical protein [Flavitalea sp.]
NSVLFACIQLPKWFFNFKPTDEQGTFTVLKTLFMKQETKFSTLFSRRAMLILHFVVVTQTAYDVSAQNTSRFINEEDNRKGTVGMVVGGILIFSGTIGTFAQNTSASTGYSSPVYDHAYNPLSSVQPYNNQKVSINLWPAVIAGGTIVSAIGLDRLITTKRFAPSFAIQKIPGLEHMGMKYSKLPSLGVKYIF